MNPRELEELIHGSVEELRRDMHRSQEQLSERLRIAEEKIATLESESPSMCSDSCNCIGEDNPDDDTFEPLSIFHAPMPGTAAKRYETFLEEIESAACYVVETRENVEVVLRIEPDPHQNEPNGISFRQILTPKFYKPWQARSMFFGFHHRSDFAELVEKVMISCAQHMCMDLCNAARMGLPITSIEVRWQVNRVDLGERRECVQVCVDFPNARGEMKRMGLNLDGSPTRQGFRR